MALELKTLTVAAGYARGMGWRWRRSIGMGPIRYTLSKRGVGYSVGVPGCRVSTTPDGRRYLVLSVPGTGLSWWKQLEDRSARRQSAGAPPVPQQHGGHKGKGLPPGVGRGGRIRAASSNAPTPAAAQNGSATRPIIHLQKPSDTQVSN